MLHSNANQISISRIECLIFGSLRAIIFTVVFCTQRYVRVRFLKLRPVYKMGIFSLGFVWFNVVQSGSNLTEKGDGGVCILGHFSILKKHMADGDDVPYFP